MAWQVAFADEFHADYQALPEAVQDELLLGVRLLTVYGPNLGRPHVDTLKGSEFANMKELRFRADDGVWRVAFAFDPKRNAVLLVAGDKSGTSQMRFYKKLIATADARYRAHLKRLGVS
ncbi:MAG TPA: type II toxin-antitoxin system RelE/ParE family toxin [Rhizomicrobium sp.]|jgi:hypothetical protein